VGSLDSKVAIVTGSGRGIGRGEAHALAKEGAAVTVLSRTLADVEKVAREIEELGGRTIAVECDVSKRDQVDQVVERTIEEFGAIDILVNNAQVIPAPHPLENWTEEEQRLIWESGYLGTWNFMQACFPQMKEQGGGRIINTSSSSGYSNLVGFSGYDANKEAIRAITRSGAREWAPHNILVNAISPAAISQLIEEHFPDEESRTAFLKSGGVVLDRWGDAEADIGRAVVFLAGPDASYITGCTLSVDGGAAMVV
jgi:NAD(P)-dependent dehydrogenase (short-subunit alcohol dehydrogenase family)